MAVSNINTITYYPFISGTTLTQDLSGNGKNLTFIGTIPSGTVDGKYCVGPFSSGNYIRTLTTTGLIPGEMPNYTIDMDFYVYDTSVLSYPFLMFLVDPIYKGSYLIFDTASRIRYESYWGNISSPVNAFSLNHWYNVKVSVPQSGTGLAKIYLDNALIASGTINHPANFNPNYYYLGANNVFYGNPLSGCITNVKLYDYIVEPEYTKSNLIRVPDNSKQPLVRYMFENNTKDTMGNYDATNYANVNQYVADGKDGTYCIGYPSGGQTITINNVAPRLYDSSFTVTWWEKDDYVNAGGHIFSVRNLPYQGWLIYNSSSSNKRYGTASLVSGNTVMDVSIPTTGTWYHNALTFDNSNTTKIHLAYTNGIQVGSGNFIPNIETSGVYNVSYIIGSAWTGQHASGTLIDDFRVYNRVLSSGEIFNISRG